MDLIENEDNFFAYIDQNEKYIEIESFENADGIIEKEIIAKSDGVLNYFANDDFIFYIENELINTVDIYENSSNYSYETFNGSVNKLMANCGSSSSDVKVNSQNSCKNDRKGTLRVKVTQLINSTSLTMAITLEQKETGARKRNCIFGFGIWYNYSNNKWLFPAVGESVMFGGTQYFVALPGATPCGNCFSRIRSTTRIVSIPDPSNQVSKPINYPKWSFYR